MLTKTDYALRAVVSLGRAQDKCLSSQAIADEQQISQRFLEHILTDLRRAGVVTSRRGGNGGYFLAVPPDELNLGTIISAVDPDFLRRPKSASTPSPVAGRPVEHVWSALEADLRTFLEGKTLRDLVEQP